MVQEVLLNLKDQVQNKFLHVTGTSRINQTLNVYGHHYALHLCLARTARSLSLSRLHSMNISKNDQMQRGQYPFFTTIWSLRLKLGFCFQNLDSKDKFKVQETQQILTKQ